MLEKKILINRSFELPIELSINTATTQDLTWHKDMAILLVLDGQLDLIVDDEHYLLKPDDIIVINAKSIYELQGNPKATYLALLIDLTIFPGKENLIFRCNSSTDQNRGIYSPLKRILAELVKLNSVNREENIYFSYSLVYALIYELIYNFKALTKQVGNKINNRLLAIVSYLEANYQKGLTLKELASHSHLSIPYLSAFFKTYLGQNFQAYYNNLRLNAALKEMLFTDNSLEAIAHNSGFTNLKYFTQIFKEKYQQLPSIYRKNYQNLNQTTNYSTFAGTNYLSLLAQYLPTSPNKSLTTSNLNIVKEIDVQDIDFTMKGSQLTHNYKTFISVGRAKELLYKDVQTMLTELQATMHYKYIKFHGLLADDMLIYSEDAAGNPHYSFLYLDKIVDFLLSIKLKPLLEFSFMPSALASDKSRVVYASPYNTSMPKDIHKWDDLISAIVNHLIKRYTLEEVKTWLFCVWNEPDTPETIFGFSNYTDFFYLYEHTYKAVKKINHNLQFGSPSLLSLVTKNYSWFKNFIDYTKKTATMPDFLNFHYYDNDFSDLKNSQSKPAEPATNKLNSDENSFSNFIKDTKSFLATINLDKLPLYLTEWNLTVSHRNLLNDTCFKSCYLLKNLLENYDELASFGYWVLTDLLEELYPSNEEFHGGLGLYTYNGIKKPHFYAFSFLPALKNKLLKKDKGYFITKDNNSLVLIIYNYVHFNHLFAQGEAFDMTFTKRYTPFNEIGKMHIQLAFTNCPTKGYLYTETTINTKAGSAFDEWVRMGALPLTKADITYLKQKSLPQVKKQYYANNEKSLTFSWDLDPLEVRLIEINFNPS